MDINSLYCQKYSISYIMRYKKKKKMVLLLSFNLNGKIWIMEGVRGRDRYITPVRWNKKSPKHSKTLKNLLKDNESQINYSTILRLCNIP